MNDEHYYGVTRSGSLSHAGKKGMKWGFNKGQKNGNRVAESYDEYQKMNSKFQKDYDKFQKDKTKNRKQRWKDGTNYTKARINRAKSFLDVDLNDGTKHPGKEFVLRRKAVHAHNKAVRTYRKTPMHKINEAYIKKQKETQRRKKRQKTMKKVRKTLGIKR